MTKEAARRIVIVNGSPLPSVGGIQSFTTALAREATRLGHRVSIVSTTPERQALRGTFEDVPIYRLRSIPAVQGRFPIPFLPHQFTRTVSDLFASGDKALVVIQARFYITSLLFAAVARIYGHRCVVIDHGAAHFTLHKPVLDEISAAYEHFWTSLLCLLRPRFFAVSPASKAWLRHFGIEAAGTISNGVDASLLAPRSRMQGGNQVSILYCGRLLKQKGVVELLQAFRDLEDESGRYRLIIAGDGPLRGEVSAAATHSRSLCYLGPVDHSRALELTAASDIVVCLSKWPEGFPTSSLEAGAFGRALVTTPHSAGELVEHQRTGIVLEDPTPANIADTIRTLANDASLRSTLGEALRERVMQNFTWPAIVGGFLREAA